VIDELDDDLDPAILEALAAGLPAAPGPLDTLRQRIFARAGGPERFLPFLDRMMTLFDLPESETQAHLHSVDDDDAWEELLPGVRFRDFEAGAAAGDAHGGLVRLPPGASFPHHRHVGEERMLILQGVVVDDQGRQYRAGDTIVSSDGSGHELRNTGDTEAIYAALVVAIEFVGDDDDDDDDDDDRP
jgi:quercetin dioxygenase-like cupin family protein